MKFRIPCGGMIAGPSQSGKTSYLLGLVEDAEQVFDPPPRSIVYAYGEYDERVHEFQKRGATLYSGFPPEELLNATAKPALFILDDLMTASKNPALQDLYTKKIHHKNLAVFYASQNLFDRNSMVARLNSQYIVLMRAPNAALHIRTIGVQLFPRQLDYFIDAYHQATQNPYDCLVIDMHPLTKHYMRLRKGVRSGEEHTVYLPKSKL